MPAAPMVTRFAPAPTGYLHLGHVVNALYVWTAASRAGGEVRLRIEDHDRQRSRPAYDEALREDLAWLGFVPQGAVVRQHERDDIYREAVARLQRDGRVYGCRCTRADLDRVPAGDDGERRYPGTCRTLELPLDDRCGWRVRLDDVRESFVDGLCGLQVQWPAQQCGDLLIRDRLGNWTYQYAVTVDDFHQQVTDIIRGIDLLPSTGRQFQLARLLGRPEPPRVMHHPLVMKSATAKLSKSDHDTGIRDLRAAGWSAHDVLSHARMLAGPVFDEWLAREAGARASGADARCDYRGPVR